MSDESTYLTFSYAGASASGKTSIWSVYNKYDGSHVGDVRWFGRWRKYCFYPSGQTVFEHKCLRDLADFMQEETTGRGRR